MKTTREMIATVGLMGVLAASAVAQPGTGTYASGLLHDPVGGVSTLNVTDRKLTACCLGSTGKDGVEVRLDAMWGGGLAIDPGVFLGTTGTLRTEWKGWDGTVKGAIELTSNGDGSATVTADFTAIGATGIRTVVYGDNGGVDSDTTTAGPMIQANVIVPMCPDGSPPVWWSIKLWDANAGHYVYMWVWSCAKGYNLSGDPYPGLRVITPIVPVGMEDTDGVDTMRVTGTDPNQLTLVDAGLQTFGVSSWGVGNAHLEEQCGGPAPCDRPDRQLVVSNIGSSGEDGVSLFEDGEIAVGSQLSVTTVGTPLVGTQTLRWRRGSDLSGHVIIMKSEVFPDPGTGESQISVDFSGIGATEYQATFYDPNDAPLGTALIANNVSWTINPCPAGSVWVNKLPPALSGCFLIVDPLGRSFGPVGTITFDPVDPLIPLGSADSCEITSTDAGGSIIIGDVVVTPPCPGDTDGDGHVNITDLGVVLSQFGATGPGLAGDLDGDGNVNITDLGLILAYFGASCP